MSLTKTQSDGEMPDLVVRLEGQRIRDLLGSLRAGKDLRRQRFGPDEEIFREGQAGASAFLVLEGAVLIQKKGTRGRVRQIARLQEGDVFGEMALFDSPTRSATVRAGGTGATALEIRRDQLGVIFSEVPQVARWLLKVLSHRLRIATKMNAEMEQIQHVNRRIIDGQEQERRRIARDIHDGPAQAFADYTMRLQIIQKMIDRDPGRAKTDCDQLRASIGEGLDALRKLIHNLHLQDTPASGLKAAIQKFVARLSRDVRFEVGFDFDDRVASDLADHLKTTVYCLVQEAMNNIRKHAKATRVEVRLRAEGDRFVVLEVEDDGVGFDVDRLLAEYHTRESLGMTSMKERCALAGGRMRIRSDAGKGTAVRFTFPRDAAREDA